jgi:hypothetical protein
MNARNKTTLAHHSCNRKEGIEARAFRVFEPVKCEKCGRALAETPSCMHAVTIIYFTNSTSGF